MANNVAWYSQKVCFWCRKEFSVRNINEWAYKEVYRGIMRYFCSWGCICAHRGKQESLQEQKQGKKQHVREPCEDERLYADSLRSIRTFFNLRQKDVAAHIGVNIARIAAFENGFPIPRARLRQISEAFGCTEDDLMSGRFDAEAAAAWQCVISREDDGHVLRDVRDGRIAREEVDKAVLGSNIRARREANGLLAKQVAAKIGVSSVSLSKYENGRCMPRRRVLDDIARVLGCTVGDLLAGAGK